MRGRRVVCPKCGREGSDGVSRFKAKGRVYYYVYVYHPEGRKCIIKRVEEPAKTTHSEELERLRRENEELRRKVEELEREKAEAEAKAQAVRYMLAASLVLQQQELMALKSVYVAKKGYTEAQREQAKTIMHKIIDKGLQAGSVLIAFPEPQALHIFGL